MTRLPTTFYIALGNYGPNRHTGRNDICAMDLTESLDDAADQLVEVESNTGVDGRVLEVTLDFASNMPETIRDVTAECVEIVQKRLRDRGYVVEAAE
jgi:hypothetical protein